MTTLVVTFLEQTTLSVIPFPTPLQYVFPLVQKTVREIYLFPDSATPVTEEWGWDEKKKKAIHKRQNFQISRIMAVNKRLKKQHLSELTLSSIVNASAVGHSAQMVQCVHTGREIGITHRLHCWLLKRCGKVYMLCDTVRSSESYVSGKEPTMKVFRQTDSMNDILLYVLGRHSQPGTSHSCEVHTTRALTFLWTRPTQTAVVLPSL